MDGGVMKMRSLGIEIKSGKIARSLANPMHTDDVHMH
jgi:hypothetical protein